MLDIHIATSLKKAMHNMMNKPLLWWVLVLAWCAIIFYFTESPTFTGANTQKIIDSNLSVSPGPGETVKYLNLLIRKSAHLIAFGILALLLWKAIYPKRWAYVGAWTLATFYGGLDEWHQSYIPGRSASVNDVLIDSLGALVVLLLLFLFQKFLYSIRVAI
jgi:VanZ family protein